MIDIQIRLHAQWFYTFKKKKKKFFLVGGIFYQRLLIRFICQMIYTI